MGRVPIDYARIFSYYEWIRYRVLYSDLKEQITYRFVLVLALIYGFK